MLIPLTLLAATSALASYAPIVGTCENATSFIRQGGIASAHASNQTLNSLVFIELFISLPHFHF